MVPTHDLDQLWSITEAAKYLRVSVAFLRKSVRERQVPFLRVGQKVVRFSRADLDSWVRVSQSEPAKSSRN